MAASSAKDKAQSLKDSYVAGLIEGEAAGSAPVMPEQDMGEQAKMIMDLDNKKSFSYNDGDPTVSIMKGDKSKRFRLDSAAYPLDGEPYGTYTENGIPMSESELRKAAELFFRN